MYMYMYKCMCHLSPDLVHNRANVTHVWRVSTLFVCVFFPTVVSIITLPWVVV